MDRFVPPFQGLGKIATPTRGRAQRRPGLICPCAFGAPHRAIQLHPNHHRPVNFSRRLRVDRVVILKLRSFDRTIECAVTKDSGLSLREDP